MFQTGSLFEGQFEYDVRLGPNLFINFWAKGSWLRITGKGNLDEILSQFVGVAVSPPIRFFDSIQGGQSANATFWRGLTSLGLAARLDF